MLSLRRDSEDDICALRCDRWGLLAWEIGGILCVQSARLCQSPDGSRAIISSLCGHRERAPAALFPPAVFVVSESRLAAAKWGCGFDGRPLRPRRSGVGIAQQPIVQQSTGRPALVSWLCRARNRKTKEASANCGATHWSSELPSYPCFYVTASGKGPVYRQSACAEMWVTRRRRSEPVGSATQPGRHKVLCFVGYTSFAAVNLLRDIDN